MREETFVFNLHPQALFFLPSKFKESSGVQFINVVKEKAVDLVSENATVLLTAGGVVGTVATAVLTGRATFKAAEIIRNEELKAVHEEGPVEDTLVQDTMGLSNGQKVKLVWPLYVLPVAAGTATVTAIVFSHRMSAQKAAALAAAYGMSQKHFEEYREKVAEKLTGPKKQTIDDELAQERVKRTSGSGNIVVVEGEVLCFDEPTGRYFTSTMENIKQAVNTTNAEILHHDHASASFFYEELGLPATTWTDEVGWNTDNLLDLKYSTVMDADDRRPCISIDFKVLPRVDYVPKHY
jgi:hypothetical protein